MDTLPGADQAGMGIGHCRCLDPACKALNTDVEPSNP